MANKIISDLESVVSVTGDMLMPLENSIGTFAGSVDDLKNYIIANFPNASQTVKGFLELATNAEVAGASDSSRAIVPSSLAALFGTSLRSTNGNVRLPIKVGGVFDEIIVQHGTESSIGPTSTRTVTFPSAFPNAILSIQVTLTHTDITNTDPLTVLSSGTTLSQFQIRNSNSGSKGAYWFAIGY